MVPDPFPPDPPLPEDTVEGILNAIRIVNKVKRAWEADGPRSGIPLRDEHMKHLDTAIRVLKSKLRVVND